MMKKRTYSIMAAALLLASGALLTTACGNDDAAIDNPISTVGNSQPIQFTATLAPKSGDGAQTRAITTGKDSDNKEILNVAWAANEKIALYYEKADGTHATVDAKVTAVDATTGAATITADLDAETKDGGTVKFVYPSTLHNGSGDIDESKLMTQYGKIDGIANSISKKFDAATATGKITLSGGTSLPTTATVTNSAGTGSVLMQNRVCICKFRLSVYTIGVNGTVTTLFSGTNDDLTISDGNGHTYTIKSTKDWPGGVMPSGATGNPGYATGDDIYVAMLPIENQSLTLSLTYTDNSVKKNLTLTTKPGTLAAGKFYRNVPVTMELEGMQVTGDITQTLTVPDGMTVTMNGANINTTSAPAIVLGEGSKLIVKGTNTVRATLADAIQCNGNATIEFQSTTNTVTAVTAANKGIQIADGKTLNITGSGSTSLSGNIGLPASASLKFDGHTASHDIYIPDGATISGSGVGIGSTITIGSGETFTLSMTTISVTSGPAIQCSGNATIILDGTNTVTTTAEGYPAIQAGGSGTTLTIQGSGSVTATGAQYAAGIGGGYKSTCGNITICGGTVTATGNIYGAGIGSGNNSSTCGNITISGGTVTATGNLYGAGIGSGDNSTCGNITISGGTVTAKGSQYAAGIGSGWYGKFASITITGGITSVKACRGKDGVTPIGKGANDQGSGEVSIDGSTTWTAGVDTEHLYFKQSQFNYDKDTWTLTHK